MPRGANPNSRKALEEGRKKTLFNHETAVKANEKSLETKRKLKTFKELDDETTTDEERKQMLDMLKKRAKQGNLRAYELYRDTMGMKPVDKVEQTATNISIDLGALDDTD